MAALSRSLSLSLNRTRHDHREELPTGARSVVGLLFRGRFGEETVRIGQESRWVPRVRYVTLNSQGCIVRGVM